MLRQKSISYLFLSIVRIKCIFTIIQINSTYRHMSANTLVLEFLVRICIENIHQDICTGKFSLETRCNNKFAHGGRHYLLLTGQNSYKLSTRSSREKVNNIVEYLNRGCTQIFKEGILKNTI